MTARRRISALALSLAAVAALPAAAAQAKATPSPCAHKGSKTLASNSTSRVYSVKVANGGADGMTTGKVYGCWRSGDRRTLLAVNYDDDVETSGGVTALTLGGRFVLVLYTTSDQSCKADCPPGYTGVTYNLSAFNLKTRKHKTLDTANVDPKSLKISGKTATWTVDGAPKSASLG